MATFLLVHGAWHGGWCWERVVPLLEAAGHRALAPDLPGMGNHAGPLPDDPIAAWGQFIADLARQQDEAVILVGHSRGGIVISQAAEFAPESIALLVYLTAFLVPPGEAPGAPLAFMPNPELERNIVLSEDMSTSTVAASAIPRLFYNTSDAQWAERAVSLVCPEPTSYVASPMRITEDRAGRVPRIYIECMRDRAIPIRLQRHMADRMPCRRTLTLFTDHSPFYSAPAALANALLDGSGLT
ncbi:alpha/beta fold hydrolase [Iodidimonas sp. SYSU 1G8]|uniref:alpha/beta fold hydrolase n=1 Tax=Iodidimonas sp. SYSU 1G8 TaxID=3133967 RepID=UPI0031FEE482